MKKKKFIEEVDLYVDSRSQTVEEKQEISDYISNYKLKKSSLILSKKNLNEKRKKNLI